ncbi:phosphoribosylformylglycinamidine synthase [Marinoscillum furvescens]|uniref:Phosphoribosylformylglycinamidine synthase n=1 Tax=Marinoscillum furvescens DSM 4134 TaxID=1122208 RepID=A0A3D9L942_MARFU|nr:phosphoribosylformylglycinamidine synthase [Marinoscillum furvescens]REE02194.1 phosphoribosylformylglycinamidine synthase [Marinoscillum furvescens DSM 4134]
MIYIFQKSSDSFFVVGSHQAISAEDQKKLTWLFSGATPVAEETLSGDFIGPRKEMITPWSTNAVEIAQNAGVSGLFRIENFRSDNGQLFDPMLQQRYDEINQDVFTLNIEPAPIQYISDLEAYNKSEGLALSDEEITFLKEVSDEIGRDLTDSEVFGFSQINSEHCRHKIFNGTFIIDGDEQPMTLFQWIKKTSKDNPNQIVSAYKDNVAFIKGPVVEQFAPKTQDKPDYFQVSDYESVISLKAETHNFPTTVEPFNGAATGSGGEIRDRMAGGTGSFPLAGSAVYMTSYSRLEKGKKWEENLAPRKWLYQSPKDILIKASNGASDYGNKFGQPLICGSLLTFEHEEEEKTIAFDKVIMLAGGIGFAKLKDGIKQKVEKDQTVVILGGDNYRIGMGGSAVSSVDTGAFDTSLELNAVQRSNPEMQKRVANAVRAMAELVHNPIVSIHDHGAGGHLNCLSELVEETGGNFKLENFPVGDPTLSEKELMVNESQERMGLVIRPEDAEYLKKVSERERAPYYEVGTTSDDMELKFQRTGSEKAPFDLKLGHLFGASPKTILTDTTQKPAYTDKPYDADKLEEYLEEVLQLEGVASKDWLTNKVDRSVTGKVAVQQTVGEIQVPLNNVAVMALDYLSNKGMATSIGHAPVPALIHPGAGSRLSVTEALTNMVWAPLTHGLPGVSLSANWMWPAKNDGENARLYQAVKELSEFASALGINIPTGKDSLSMAQKYPDGKKVLAPGTVIISSVGEVSDITQVVTPNLKPAKNSDLIYVSFSNTDFALGGSSFAQTRSMIGTTVPDADPHAVRSTFEAIQSLVADNLLLAGHDISSGGLITALLEMNFPNTKGGLQVDLSVFEETDIIKILFSENPGVLIQTDDTDKVLERLQSHGATAHVIGQTSENRSLKITKAEWQLDLSIDDLRDVWYKTSHLLDREQTAPEQADLRFANFKNQPLSYQLPKDYEGTFASYGIDPKRRTETGIKAAIIREKGVNGDREMAYALYLAGFDVKDVHMTDLIAGREDLSDVNMIVYVGGFSNSDVLGSAKGWAGSFIYNEKAKAALDAFYAREDTLSLGVCNGCQLMMELGLIYPEMGEQHPRMHHNITGKFESAFVDVTIQKNDTVLFGSLSDSRMGIWLAHGEGRFVLPGKPEDYNIPVNYAYDSLPGNPNGSDFATAAVASRDGRHVAIMPHLERTIFPWNWAHQDGVKGKEISPWIEPFVNAKKWITERN